MPDYQILLNFLGVFIILDLIVLEIFDTLMDEREEELFDEMTMSV